MMPDDEFEREHPSYGILHISRAHHGTSAIRLFGSPLATHYGTIRLTISKGKWLHGLHHDRFFGTNKDHIEIEMSAAQFADAITSLNIGSGTPCTVRYIAGKQVSDPPDFPTEAEHIRDNFEGSLDTFANKARKYRTRIEELTAKLSTKAREEIRIALDVITQQLTHNVPFIAKQFQEATTRVTTAAKAEVEAFVTGAIRAAGLQAIADGRLPSLLPVGKPTSDAWRLIIRAGMCPACHDETGSCLAQCPLAGDPRCQREHIQNCAALMHHDDSVCDCALRVAK